MRTMEAGTRVDFKFLVDFTTYFDDYYLDDANFVETANREGSPYTACVWTMGNTWVIDDLANDIKLQIELFDKIDLEGPKKMLQIIVRSQQ